MERTIAKSLSWPARLGSRPVGKTMPLLVSGLKLAGVIPGTILKSNVSVWLGAPAHKMKITFFAVFIAVTEAPEVSAALAYRSERTEPPTPAPRISKKRRRVQCGRLKKLL